MFSLPTEGALAGVPPYPVANISSNLTERALPKLHCLVFVTSKEQLNVCWLLCGPGLCNDRLQSALRGFSHELAPAAHRKAGLEGPQATAGACAEGGSGTPGLV